MFNDFLCHRGISKSELFLKVMFLFFLLDMFFLFHHINLSEFRIWRVGFENFGIFSSALLGKLWFVVSWPACLQKLYWRIDRPGSYIVSWGCVLWLRLDFFCNRFLIVPDFHCWQINVFPVNIMQVAFAEIILNHQSFLLHLATRVCIAAWISFCGLVNV